STNHNGIAITIPEAGTHQIRITPHSCPFTAGWGNAFGYKSDNTGNANTAANKQKLISIDAPLTTMAFAPQEEVGNTSASWMFANIFYGCTNLITPAKIADTYKLPKKITDLSYFLHATYAGNTFLTSPIDLRNISGWFSNNEKITNLSNFLQNTHYGNSNLNLTGQKIFPNWIKTLQGGTGPSTAINDIKDVQGAFSQMFYCGSAKGGDTGEPEFEDDDDPITGSIVKLSDLGNPSTPRYTYRGRTVITSNTNIDDNWK
ncbi:MAG: hypothetical protein LBS54_08570, partial [Dysgonamonadaceae bacterium]|nr:hypothetical protein [Dysgonamonadaceae bacterium]